MSVIFVDTSAWLALLNRKDQYHRRANDCWRALAAGKQKLMTSNLVLSETLTLVGRRVSYEFSADQAELLYGMSLLTVLRPGYEQEMAALMMMRKYADQGVSFADCVSFALMKRGVIPAAFTFDRHFAMAGFQLVPE